MPPQRVDVTSESLADHHSEFMMTEFDWFAYLVSYSQTILNTELFASPERQVLSLVPSPYAQVSSQVTSIIPQVSSHKIIDWSPTALLNPNTN